MSLPDEASRVAASSLLARLGIIVSEREWAYPMGYEMTETRKFPEFTWWEYRFVPALGTARKFNSSIR